jgi:hypothetical protein
MEIGRSKFYSKDNKASIFNGLFYAYRGFFQVTCRWMDGWMDRWIDGWVGKWMGGGVDAWTV